MGIVTKRSPFVFQTRSVFVRCAFALFAIMLFGATLRAQDTTSYYLAGQVHPRFQVTLSVNGETVKTIKPKPTKAMLFIKQIDEELLRTGANSLGVSYRVNSGVAEDVTPMPSFIVKLQSQSDPTDSSTKRVLAEIRGPDRPFPSEGGASLSETFEVTE